VQLQIPDPEMQRGGLPATPPNCISTALTTPKDDSETAVQLQDRRLVRLFFLPPETAATIVRLAYEVAR
jgi:hypothetical protein